MKKAITVKQLIKLLQKVENQNANVSIVDVNADYDGHVLKATDIQDNSFDTDHVHIFVKIADQNPNG